MDPVAELHQVIELNKSVKPAEAEQRFELLIKACSEAELHALREELATALDSFYKKRRRHLAALLAERLEPPRRAPEQEAPVADKAGTDPLSDVTSAGQALLEAAGSPPVVKRYSAGSRQLMYNYDKFRADLEKISAHHGFRWSTAYRKMITEYFQPFHDELCTTDHAPELLGLIRAALSDHSKEIFSKVFLLYKKHNTWDTNYIVDDVAAGLQRFLDLVLEFYSARLIEPNQSRQWIMLRQLCSAMIFGILNGYARAQFDRPGSQVLPTLPQYWAYALPFLTHGELSELVEGLDTDDLIAGIRHSVFPLVDAIDIFLDSDPGLAPLPALSQYDSKLRRLDVSLVTPSGTNSDQLHEILCYTDAEYVHPEPIKDAAARKVSAVVAPLTAELRTEFAAMHGLSDFVVPADGTAVGRLREVLAGMGHQSKSASPDRPITFNWAHAFPLENQARARYKHVYRVSAVRLLQSAERRGGVRLWCSVRRSGKTTACASDLDTTASGAAFIPQTCESTGYMISGGLFYKHVQNALESGERLPEDFVTRTVAKCVPIFLAKETKIVLILDEYETLFGDLRTSLEKQEDLRYRVVQPLLNQLVSFSHENLLIFVGQQPNAHSIILDQNQLSPVVEQDSFPLFTHDPARGPTGEFYELLSMVLSGHIELDMDFVTSVYAETGGHPYLTVKLLDSFMNWLIKTGKPISCFAPLRPELFAEFTGSNLESIAILNNQNYRFFKDAAAEHLSPDGRKTNPWLHAAYSALCAIALCSPDSLELSLDDYAASLAPDCLKPSPQELLKPAIQANFLTDQDGMVRPRIPLLARIAAAVTPI
ncbi:MAG: hypothetical protein ABSB76_21510 [Streptosporangiaceae bacterium]|jgi:hypothetical protein